MVLTTEGVLIGPDELQELQRVNAIGMPITRHNFISALGLDSAQNTVVVALKLKAEEISDERATIRSNQESSFSQASKKRSTKVCLPNQMFRETDIDSRRLQWYFGNKDIALYLNSEERIVALGALSALLPTWADHRLPSAVVDALRGNEEENSEQENENGMPVSDSEDEEDEEEHVPMSATDRRELVDARAKIRQHLVRQCVALTPLPHFFTSVVSINPCHSTRAHF